jgi:hypothetical protein
MSENKTLYLSKEERLGLQNLNLRRQMLEVRVQQELGSIEQEEKDLVKEINARLSEDIANYRVNIQTGECVYAPPPKPAPEA